MSCFFFWFFTPICLSLCTRVLQGPAAAAAAAEVATGAYSYIIYYLPIYIYGLAKRQPDGRTVMQFRMFII